MNKNIFGPSTIIRHFKKKELILLPGQTEHYVSYIIKGSAALLVNQDGTEVCLNFFLENQYFSAYSSFLSQTPSAEYVLALEDTTLASISHNDLQAGYQLSAAHERNGRRMAEKLYLQSRHRTLALLTQSAEERYLDLVTKQAQSLERIPLKYLASYLGITPVSLSRIRKKITES